MCAPSRSDRYPSGDDLPGWLCMMQHHGVPTRLLDWTESVMLAAYFALVHDGAGPAPAIWVLTPRLMNRVAIGKESVFLLKEPPCKELVEQAFLDKAGGGGHEGAESRKPAYAALGSELGSRMMVQQTAFTIHAGAEALDQHPRGAEFLTKIELCGGESAEITRLVRYSALTRCVVFPDLENLGRDISDWPKDKRRLVDRV